MHGSDAPPKYVFDEDEGALVLNPEWVKRRADELTFNDSSTT